MLVIVLHHRVEIFMWSLKPRTGSVVIRRRQLPLMDGDTMTYLSVYRSKDKESNILSKLCGYSSAFQHADFLSSLFSTKSECVYQQLVMEDALEGTACGGLVVSVGRRTKTTELADGQQDVYSTGCHESWACTLQFQE